MKNKSILIHTLVLVSILHPQLSILFAQGMAFTYQGRLNDGANPANGTYDLRFALFDALAVGNQAGSPLTNSAVNVSNGVFTVTLDFGANFPGADRWLEIGVRANGGGTFTTLLPRQQMTATPYAITAGNLSGALPSASLSGTYPNAVTLNNGANSFTGSGAGLTALDANQLTNGTVPSAALGNAWKTTGNSGTTPGAQFIGTTDSQPLEFKANGVRALRLEPTTNGAPNLIAGFNGNWVLPGTTSATIAGGGGNGGTNRVTASGGTIGGGLNNAVSNWNGTVGGGANNTASGNASIVSGGSENLASGDHAVIGGGQNNTARDHYYATVGGGERNTAAGDASTVSGGSDNLATGDAATIAGGNQNTIETNAQASTIAGGRINRIQTSAAVSTIGGGIFNTIYNGAFQSTIGGGAGNEVSGPLGTVPGGDNNLAGTNSFAAGHRAKATHTGSFVWADSTDADFASTGGDQFLLRASGGVGIGKNNPASALDVNGTVTASAFQGNGANLTNVNAVSLGGLNQGSFWQAGGNTGANPTNNVFLGTTDNLPLEIKVNGERALRIEPNGTSPNLISGSSYNVVSNGLVGAVIGGGGDLGNPNRAGGNFSTVPGGRGNTASGYVSTAMGYATTASGSFSTAMGSGTTASGDYATVGGGRQNTASHYETTVSGGRANTASGPNSTVSGGYANTASGNFATVAAGFGNTASGRSAFVAGGYLNTASNDFSFAAGQQAKANHSGAFVWADSTFADFASTANNQFLIRASGGVGIGTPSPSAPLDVANRIRVTGPGGGGVTVALDLATYDPAALVPAGTTPAAQIRATDDSAFSSSIDFLTKSPGANGNPLISRMHIAANGGVGIGTNSPQGTLHIASPSPSTSPQLAISQLNPADYARLQIGVSTFPQWTLAVEPSATPVLNFWNGVANAASLNHNGALFAQSFNPTSDRNAKEKFRPVDARDVLAKVAVLPISLWNFKNAPGEEHLGPMAQDFREAFDLGADDKHIATVDADGVALAAIQGLNQKVEQTVKQKDAQIAELKQRLARLESLLSKLNDN